MSTAALAVTRRAALQLCGTCRDRQRHWGEEGKPEPRGEGARGARPDVCGAVLIAPELRCLQGDEREKGTD